MKVGDLVRMINDPATWMGHGVVLDMDNTKITTKAKVRWFDDWDDELIEWVSVQVMDVISEG